MKFRMVRSTTPSPSEAKAYRVETTELMTEAEAMLLMRQLQSPYEGHKYEPRAARWPVSEQPNEAYRKTANDEPGTVPGQANER